MVIGCNVMLIEMSDRYLMDRISCSCFVIFFYLDAERTPDGKDSFVLRCVVIFMIQILDRHLC